MRQLFIAALTLGLLAAGCGSTPATTTTSSGGGCALSVDVTQAAGTVWGTVTVKDGGKSYTVSSASQKIPLACGSEATLTQSPVDAATWPFAGWKSNGQTSKSGAFTLKVQGSAKVAAVYVLAGAQSSGSSPSSGSSSSSSGSGW